MANGTTELMNCSKTKTAHRWEAWRSSCRDVETSCKQCDEQVEFGIPEEQGTALRTLSSLIISGLSQFSRTLNAVDSGLGLPRSQTCTLGLQPARTLNAEFRRWRSSEWGVYTRSFWNLILRDSLHTMPVHDQNTYGKTDQPTYACSGKRKLSQTGTQTRAQQPIDGSLLSPPRRPAPEAANKQRFDAGGNTLSLAQKPFQYVNWLLQAVAIHEIEWFTKLSLVQHKEQVSHIMQSLRSARFSAGRKPGSNVQTVGWVCLLQQKSFQAGQSFSVLWTLCWEILGRPKF